MLVIGITGPTGCGKTTLLQAVQQRGGYIVDCDALYYELLKTDPALKAALQKAFGNVFAHHSDSPFTRGTTVLPFGMT